MLQNVRITAFTIFELEKPTSGELGGGEEVMKLRNRTFLFLKLGQKGGS